MRRGGLILIAEIKGDGWENGDGLSYVDGRIDLCLDELYLRLRCERYPEIATIVT